MAKIYYPIMKTLGQLAAVISLSAPAFASPTGEIAIVPAPAKLTTSEGSFELSNGTKVIAGKGAGSEADALATRLRVFTGLALPVAHTQPKEGCIDLTLDPSLSFSLGDEGYILSVVPQRVSIRAASPTGLFYGGVTLIQLLPAFTFSSTRCSLPCVQIEDRPRFPWRGLLLDPARHFLPPEFIKKFVDVMALHKLNALQLHLTDDQGWRIEIQKYPRLTQIGSVRAESPRRGDRKQGDGTPYGPFFYTQEQIRDLVAYAQARHVTLVPEIEMPGHLLAALTSYPEYSCTGGPFNVRTRWGIEPDILCPGNDEAVAFAQDILGEIVELFPSRFIHIGGDESPRIRWKECRKCQARMKAEGLTNEAQLQTWLNHRLEEFLASKGRRMIGWDEILEGGLTPQAAVMSWRGTKGGIAAAEAGHDVVMSPTSHCYFDYGQAAGPGEPECIGGMIQLEKVYAFDPVPPELGLDSTKHILGAQGNLWSEYLWTPQDVEYFAFPRAAALAEVVWSPARARNFADFHLRLQKHLPRLEKLGINFRRLD